MFHCLQLQKKLLGCFVANSCCQSQAWRIPKGPRTVRKLLVLLLYFSVTLHSRTVLLDAVCPCYQWKMNKRLQKKKETIFGLFCETYITRHRKTKPNFLF